MNVTVYKLKLPVKPSNVLVTQCYAPNVISENNSIITADVVKL